MSNELAEQLRAVLGGEIGELRRLSGGASRETWSFTIDPVQANRLEDRPRWEKKAAGVPVADVVASGGGESALGAPFIVSARLDGETIPRKLLRDDEWAAVRPQLGTLSQPGPALSPAEQV